MSLLQRTFSRLLFSQNLYWGMVLVVLLKQLFCSSCRIRQFSLHVKLKFQVCKIVK